MCADKQKENTATRLGFVHVPSTTSHPTGIRLSTLIYQLVIESTLHSIHPSELQSVLREFDQIKDNLDRDGEISSSESLESSGTSPLHVFSTSGWSIAETAAAADFWSTVGGAFKRHLNLGSSLPYLLINGRVSDKMRKSAHTQLIGPIKPGTFYVEDFDILEMYELRKRTRPVVDLLKTMYDDLSAFDRSVINSDIHSLPAELRWQTSSQQHRPLSLPHMLHRTPTVYSLQRQSAETGSMNG